MVDTDSVAMKTSAMYRNLQEAFLERMVSSKCVRNSDDRFQQHNINM